MTGMTGEEEGPRLKILLFKKSKAGGITVLDFKLYYKAVIIKTVWYWHKSRHKSMEQNKKPRNEPTTNGQLIFDKAKTYI